MVIGVSLSTKPTIALTTDPIYILSTKLMSLHIKVHVDFVDVHVSITNHRVEVMSDINELIYHFPPPPS